MSKFMSLHRVPAGMLTKAHLDQFGVAAQNDPVVRPVHSYMNLSEGNIVCIMDAPSREDLAAWFTRMQLPCEFISAVEWEGVCGVIHAG
jgi:hypothetical protein